MFEQLQDLYIFGSRTLTPVIYPPPPPGSNYISTLTLTQESGNKCPGVTVLIPYLLVPVAKIQNRPLTAQVLNNDHYLQLAQLLLF